MLPAPARRKNGRPPHPSRKRPRTPHQQSRIITKQKTASSSLAALDTVFRLNSMGRVHYHSDDGNGVVEAKLRLLPRWTADILNNPPRSGEGFHGWLFRAARALWICGRTEEDIRATLENSATTCVGRTGAGSLLTGWAIASGQSSRVAAAIEQRTFCQRTAIRPVLSFTVDALSVKRGAATT
jgi:hypothetical protein